MDGGLGHRRAAGAGGRDAARVRSERGRNGTLLNPGRPRTRLGNWCRRRRAHRVRLPAQRPAQRRNQRKAHTLGVPMWVHESVGQVWRFAEQQGPGAADFTSLIKMLEKWTRVEVPSRRTGASAG
jgi:hypothetical protein